VLILIAVVQRAEQILSQIRIAMGEGEVHIVEQIIFARPVRTTADAFGALAREGQDRPGARRVDGGDEHIGG
jgi:hypothetical protein